MLFPAVRKIIYVLLTRAPLYSLPEGNFLVRLACIRHAASVHSEPGSNPPIKTVLKAHWNGFKFLEFKIKQKKLTIMSKVFKLFILLLSAI